MTSIRRRRRRLLCLAVAAACTLLIGGCSSSSSTGGPASSSSSSSSSATVATTPAAVTSAPLSSPVASAQNSGEDLLVQAERITDLASAGFVTSPGVDYQPLSQIVSSKDFAGPTPSPVPSSAKFVYFVPAGPGNVTRVAVEAATILKGFGWKTAQTASDFSPAGDQKALETALAAKPDLIVTVAIPGALVGEQLADAKSAGISTLSIWETEASGPGYTGYIDFKHALQMEVAAAAMLNQTGDKVDVVGEPVDGYADLRPQAALKVLQTCSGCKSTSKNIQASVQFDPVGLEQFHSSILQADPAVDYFLVCCATSPLDPILSAINAAGRTGKTFVVPGDAQPAALSLMQKGAGVAFAVGTSVDQYALVTVDAIFRMVSGAKLPDPGDWGIGVYLWTAKNVFTGDPTTEKMEAQMLKANDYLTPYEKAWGKKLFTVS